MALTGSDKAYLWARSGIARSGATRSNYVPALTSIGWIRRDETGAIIAETDISGLVIQGSLHVTQALNEEPDACSFELRPQDPPAALPQVGEEIRIAWASGPSAGVTVFHGYMLVIQQDWRLANQQPPWLAIQCQDPMWRFDARIVSYRFPTQSVSDSIEFLVTNFCNGGLGVTSPLDFLLSFVQPEMAFIPAFDVINERPSTVMRRLTAAVGGGFYLEGLMVHAWAGSISEPGQTNPQPLTVDLPSLKAFRVTTDATQLRRRVLVEGRRTTMLMPLPDVDAGTAGFLGVPLTDATMFDPAAAPEAKQLTRFGPQWMHLSYPVAVRPAGVNPPQTKTTVAFTPGDTVLNVEPMPVLPPPNGWIRVGNQFSRYGLYFGDPLVGPWSLSLPAGSSPYGVFTVPFATASVVEWVDGAMNIEPRGLHWLADLTAVTPSRVWAHPTETPVVTLAVAQAPAETWPNLEGFIQDGRYSYPGAQARAEADLAAFADPLVTVEWETDDLNAAPGRSQVIALSSPNVDPPVDLTVTILSVELTFPLRGLPPRRFCRGGIIKPSSFLDVVVTTSD